MTGYALQCKKCGYTIDEPADDDYRMVDGERRFPRCPVCDKDYMFHKVLGIGQPGDYHHESHSLAIHPDQIPEHRALFPDVHVTPDGLPCFDSPRQQEKYANACGFDKKAGKSKKKLGSTRIA